MLSHFEKLNTPLKSVYRYPTLRDQTLRFSCRGWASVDAHSLWEAWSDDSFLSPAERKHLDVIEPFDEWEELALFSCHYCVVQASSRGPTTIPNGSEAGQLDPQQNGASGRLGEAMGMSYSENPGSKGRRRFGAAMTLENSLGERFIANVLGSGTSSRLSSIDLYKESPLDVAEEIDFGPGGPGGRTCHILTEIGIDTVLLTGGRTSPTTPFEDCWLFHRGTARWERTHNLPLPLYRHSITRLAKTSLGLLVGGKRGSSTLFRGCLLFHPKRGWIECKVAGQPILPVFGASLVCARQETSTRYTGILSGGITEDGVVAQQLRTWTLDITDLVVSQTKKAPLTVVYTF